MPIPHYSDASIVFFDVDHVLYDGNLGLDLANRSGAYDDHREGQRPDGHQVAVGDTGLFGDASAVEEGSVGAAHLAHPHAGVVQSDAAVVPGDQLGVGAQLAVLAAPDEELALLEHDSLSARTAPHNNEFCVHVLPHAKPARRAQIDFPSRTRAREVRTNALAASTPLPHIIGIPGRPVKRIVPHRGARGLRQEPLRSAPAAYQRPVPGTRMIRNLVAG